MAQLWRVAQVQALTEATGNAWRGVEVYEPPIDDFSAAWRCAGSWRQRNPREVYIVVEEPARA